MLPAFRGRGHGVELMEHVESRLQEMGVREAEVALVARFDRLIQFYRDMGYSSGPTERFPSLPFDVLFMRKPLPGSR